MCTHKNTWFLWFAHVTVTVCNGFKHTDFNSKIKVGQTRVYDAARPEEDAGTELKTSLIDE